MRRVRRFRIETPTFDQYLRPPVSYRWQADELEFADAGAGWNERTLADNSTDVSVEINEDRIKEGTG
jgi:hypothetical protein